MQRQPYGSRGSSAFRWTNNEEDYTQSSQSGQERTYIHGKRQGHPPGLRGKEIGLYYRDKNREKAKHANANSPVLKLSPYLGEKIKSILNLTKLSYTLPSELDKKSECENKYHHISDSQFKKKFLRIINGNIQCNLTRILSMASKLQKDCLLDKALQSEYENMQNQSDYKEMLKFREKLPAYQKKSELLQLVKNNQVVVISGETGCGKTTQVAQFILDDQLEAGEGSITRIACTQPRRISAISVAERVAAERAETLGKSVGYQIRLEKIAPREQGSILFCTTGVLLQFMKSDPALRNFSHIILDEIHERSTESDFIITLLKQVIPKRTDLKLLLMSATLNSESFSNYYEGCPMIHIPGFTYPVEEFYLEDILMFTRFSFSRPRQEPQNYIKKYPKRSREYSNKQDDFKSVIVPYVKQLTIEQKYPEYVTTQLLHPDSETVYLELIEKLVRYICETKGPGAILIFLPGMIDILNLNKMMLSSNHYPGYKYVIYPLHSRMPTVDQKLIFTQPPKGVRKIIIASSIAETSITIEDVVYVIDSGKMKLGRFDVDKNIQTLEPEWVSLANAKQRRGRAGRVKSGECYHIFSKARKMTFDKYPLPEMLRTRLEEVILQIKMLQLGRAKKFLANVMDPPNRKAIGLSLDLLRTLNALDEDENLTPLGYHLAHLPLDPRTGKMILWAALFSCVEPIFAIAASLTFKDAFYCPLGKEWEARKKKLELSMGQYSDHVALAEALRRFEFAHQQGFANMFCREYFLSYNTLKLLSEMKQDFARYLHEMKFLDSEDPNDINANRNSNNVALIKAIVCAGLYPNIAIVRRATPTGVIGWTPEDGIVRTHPSSVNSKNCDFPSRYLTYFTKQRSSAIYLHDTTCVSIPILLFARPNILIKREKGKCTINLFSDITCEPETAIVIQELHGALNTLLEYKISHPATVSWLSSEGQLLKAIIELVSQKDEDIGFGKNVSKESANNYESMDDHSH